MAEENTKAASGKIKEEEVKKVALTFDDILNSSLA